MSFQPQTELVWKQHTEGRGDLGGGRSLVLAHVTGSGQDAGHAFQAMARIIDHWSMPLPQFFMTRLKNSNPLKKKEVQAALPSRSNTSPSPSPVKKEQLNS